MRALAAAELLNVWERGQARPPAERALLLLGAACPDTSSEALAGLSVGQRDGALLRLREQTLGSQLVSLATCPECGERLELAFQVADILAPDPAPRNPLALRAGSYDVEYRLPTGGDLVAVAALADADRGRRLLLERCVTAARQGDRLEPAGELPDDVVAALEAGMAQADPQADVRLNMDCPLCGHRWQAGFDIASFFWSEIDAWAGRTLHEVHALASAYGWREADILGLSAWRRQAYLEMIAAG